MIPISRNLLLVLLLFSLSVDNFIVCASTHEAESLEFDDRHILVIGASSGMGRATAELVYTRGGKVTYCSRSLDKLQLAIEEKDKSRAFAIFCDGGDTDSLKIAIGESNNLMGGLDGVVWVPSYLGSDLITTMENAVNNGVAVKLLEKSFQMNVYNFLSAFGHALPYLKQSNDSSVVAISSVAAQMPGLLWAYNIAKAAEDSLCENLAYEFAPNIRVNCFQAGPFYTEALGPGGMDFYRDDLTWRSPYGRIGTAEEGAEFISFLLSSRSSYMTGELLRADGMITKSSRLSDFFISDERKKLFPAEAHERKCKLGEKEEL